MISFHFITDKKIPVKGIFKQITYNCKQEAALMIRSELRMDPEHVNTPDRWMLTMNG